MNPTSILAGRLQVAFAHFHVSHEVIRAFRAAYLVRCELDHLGENLCGQDSKESIRAAVNVALRRYREKPDALPENVAEKLVLPPPPAFREVLIGVVPEVDPFTLKILPRMAQHHGFDVNNDEDLVRLVQGCLWNYVIRAANNDPF